MTSSTTPSAQAGEDLTADRELPSINQKKRKSGLRNIGLGILGLGALGAVVAVYSWSMKTSAAVDAAPIKADEYGATKKLAFSEVPPPPPLPELLEDGSELAALGEATGSTSEQPGQVPAPRPAADYPRTIEEAAAQQRGQTAPPVGAVVQGGLGLGVIDKSASALMKGSAGDAVPTAKQVSEEVAALINVGAASGVAGIGASSGTAQDETGGMSGLLQGTASQPQLARRTGDRNFTLPKGTLLGCATRERIDTTVPGFLSCTLTRDVYSENGKVVLLDRGSKVDGEYSSGLQQGQNRIFVLWTEVKTPNGVKIALNSPGTDGLGASGLQGKVKTHFWKRFGAAMLVSVLDDAVSAMASNDQGSGTTVNLGNSAQTGSNLAEKILDSTINIPPTLYKRHGDRISIVVARDLDFKGVYSLATH